MYQVQCLKENGLGAAIIPRSNFSISKNINKFKEELLKHIQILKIINCNSKVFAPIASPECTIIIYKRIKSIDKPYESKNVKIIDYTNDGYKIKNKLRVKVLVPVLKEQIRNLTFNNDWNFKIENNIPNMSKLVLININKILLIYKIKF